MGRTATAEQQARQRTRQWRTELAQQQAEQDRRISAAIAAVLDAQTQVATAGEMLATARAAHAQAIDNAEQRTADALRSLKGEGLTVEQISQLTGLASSEVRRVAKPSKPTSPSGVAASPAVTDEG
ncbi:MAG: hypothetical protein ABI140_06405 [Jatrophihabitantaceae bacterium]